MVAYDETGGIPVEPDATLTSLATGPGQVRFGDTLFGSATPARLRELIGWRDLPEVELADSPRPQGPGSYPGSALPGPVTVTGIFLLRGSPAVKALALEAIERATQPSAVDRPLIVNDSTGATYRMARVVARSIPQGRHFTHAPVEWSAQWVCADPRRYAVDETLGDLAMASESGGIVYPITYPLDYGVWSGGATALPANPGTADAPVRLTIRGPVENPRVTARNRWALQFNTTLDAGEFLQVDTAEGTVLLNGDADRLFTLSTDSSPLGDCVIPPNETTPVSLSAASGTGTATVALRAAYL